LSKRISARSSFLLNVRNISAGYGRVGVLSDVTFDVSAGQVMSVVGANGAGKSTLVKVLSGMVRPSQGRIEFQGEDITNLPAHQIVLRGIVHVPEGRRLFGDMTVYENLLLGSTHPSARRKRAAGLHQAYRLFPILRERGAQVARTLSGGEQQMVAIARGLMSCPKLLILDEPSLGLAPRIVTEILNVIRALNREGLTVLLIEQNVKHSLAIADRGIVLETGRVLLADTASALLNNEHTRRAYLGM
jgi:branched-chain amino acid transport system ATP-binding protein